MPSPPIRLLYAICGLLALIPAMARAAEPEKVAFPSANGQSTPLTGYLYRPAGSGPFPAVVAMHGCGGLLTRAGKFRRRDTDWGERLAAAGIAVLFPDSFSPRGVGQICTLKVADRPVTPFERSFDANGAADWLAAQPLIDSRRIGLIGWSNGGTTVLWAVRAGAAPKRTEFKTAISFYPGCRVPLQRAAWRPRLPLKILIGALDDWTSPVPCRALAARHAIPMVEYPDAYHGFDAPDTPVRVRHGLGVTADGSGQARVGTNAAARNAAIAEVMATLNAALGLAK